MSRLLLLSSILLPFFAGCESSPDGTAVRATLEDGQLLVGAVHTQTLVLVGGVGKLEIPLADVGEVVPAEGGQLGDSEGHVSVWLRDGTEFVGRWEDPELEMGIAIAGRQVSVDLPVNELRRFQLSGGEYWPEGELYRVRTAFGDDFLVDPERTVLALDSSLGHFEPLLSECRSARPVAEATGEWRVELQTGTVLVGSLSASEIRFALPMGPDSITVPLEVFSSLERQQWRSPPAMDTGRRDGLWQSARKATAASETADALPSSPSPVMASPEASSGEWFSRAGLQSEREEQYSR